MIDLNAVRAEFTLRDHSYHSVRLPSDISHEVLLLSGNQASDPNAQSDVFIFQNGVIVFWNLPESEHKVFISRVRKYCREVVSESRIEREDLRYCFSDEHTRLVGEDIYLQNHEGRVQSHDFHTDERIEQPGDSAATATPSSKHRVDQMVMNQSPEKGLHLVPVEDPIRLEQFAFSEALALSVKLALLENSFDSVAVQMEPWIERMKNGFGLNFPRSSVLKKTGELFTIRHLLNISTSMIETPDFYWDRPEVESLYTQLRTVLSVPTRTRVLNSRLNMCCELTEILSNHLQSRHACRLEWMIILLILVEVAFEAFYYYERRQEKKQLSIST
ncbi:required for meiotic nuclear division protein 1 homolog [Clonorchis sinensis]|nr:required for meiotic nuclear division protein 1 homolog [Clonorchis sinensis]